MTSSAATASAAAPTSIRFNLYSCEGRSPDSSLLGPRLRGGGGPLVRHLHDQRGVGAAEAEAVVEHGAHRPFLGLERDEVDALGALARIVEIERRRDDLVAHGEDAKDALDRSCAAE